MAFWNRTGTDESFPKGDRGTGSFTQYRYNLVPSNERVTMRLADSNPHQTELVSIGGSGESQLETAISRRSAEDERTDAAMIIRLFVAGRVSGILGTVPRGLESVVDEALSRLEKRGDKVRIPARLVSTRDGWRVDLLLGHTR